MSGSYYDRPVIKEPTWQARDIAGYLFLGGLAGASSALGAGAELTGRRRLARSTKLGALGAVSLSLAALVHDLGRPGRFLNMLRVAKPTSPMSVGSWLLAGYGPLAGAAAARRIAVAGAALDLAASQRMEAHAGLAGETFREGKAGAMLRAAKALTAIGGLGAAAGGRNRVTAGLSGLALLAGSACTRFGIFEAGRASARDPKYTVVPQRERLERGVRAG